MDTMKRLRSYFSTTELALWAISLTVIIGAFLLFDRVNYLTLVASVIGVTSLILNAKGNPYGQLLMVVFSVLYGVISFKAAYYGEMITYLGMTAPMALFSMVTWFRNTTQESALEVKIRKMRAAEVVIMAVLAAVVTAIFYFMLKFFNTANLLLSTLSVTTSFVAVYLTAMRNSFYTLGYAANDLVLIALWAMVIPHDTSAVSVMLCFVAFLVNDIYGFINWNRLYKKQSQLGSEQ